jgi:hypothetical protein
LTDLRTFLAEMALDSSRFAEFLRDPESAIRAEGLSDEDRDALLSGIPAMIAARLAAYFAFPPPYYTPPVFVTSPPPNFVTAVPLWVIAPPPKYVTSPPPPLYVTAPPPLHVTRTPPLHVTAPHYVTSPPPLVVPAIMPRKGPPKKGE